MTYQVIVLSLLFGGLLTAQSVTYNVTGAFRSQNGTVTNKITYGSGADILSVEYLPPPVKVADPSTATFVNASFGTIRTVVDGSPDLSQLPDYSLVLTIAPSGGADVGTITGAISYRDFRLPLRLSASFSPFNVATVNGVHYSVALDLAPLADPVGARVTTVNLTARLTRGSTIINPTDLTVDSDPLNTVTRTVGVTTVGGTAFSGSDGTDYINIGGGAAGAKQATIYIRPLDSISGPSTVQLQLFAPGVPPASMRLTVVYPPPAPIEVNPREATFFYTRGGAPPADQYATVTSTVSSPLFIGYYDTSWLSVIPSYGSVSPALPAMLTLRPNLFGKSNGTHTTNVRIQPRGNEYTSLKVNFFVNDGPGSLQIRPQPENGGTVQLAPQQASYENGSQVMLTAVPNTGFTFVRWTGAVSSTANPVQLMINGETAVTAEFSGPAPCTFTANPSRLVIPASGDTGTIDVATQPYCYGGFGSSQIVTVIPFGFGPGSVKANYIVQANASEETHSSLLFVGGATGTNITVEQAPKACSGLTGPPSLTLAQAGGPFLLPVVSNINCALAPVSSQQWLGPVSSLSYLGSSKIPFSARPNPLDRPRTAFVSLAGYRVPVIQRAAQPVLPFADVTDASPFADSIALLKLNNITEGCAPGLYCPGDPMTRSQMAVFLVRAMLGSDDFAYSPAPLFQDVPASHPHFKWIQKLYALGVTEGCGAGTFCPGDPVTRGQMAQFLFRTRVPRATQPSPLQFNVWVKTPFFSDVPAQHPFFAPIQKMREWGITGGCNATDYCPDASTTREQMAAFLIRAFFTK